jgi:hypothetical protein
MRDRLEIEKHLFATRIDLEDRIAELRETIRDRLAISARARHAVDEAFRARPIAFVVVVVGLLAATVATLLFRRRRAFTSR